MRCRAENMGRGVRGWAGVLLSIVLVGGVSVVYADKLKPDDLKLGRGELGLEHPKGYTLASSAKVDKDPATGSEQLWITYRAANGSKNDATLDWCSSGFRFRMVKPGTVERQHIHFPLDGIWRYMNWVASLDCGLLPAEKGAVIETESGIESLQNVPAHVPTSRVVVFHAKHVPALPLRWILKVVYDKASPGLELTTIVERSEDGFKYSYAVKNSLTQAAFVQWASLVDPKSPSGLVFEIPPGSSRTDSWTSRTPPILVNDVAAFNAKGAGSLPGDKLRVLGVDPDWTQRRKNLRELRSTPNDFILAPALNSQDRAGLQ